MGGERGEREGGREGEREGGREGGREGEGGGGREGGREGEWLMLSLLCYPRHWYFNCPELPIQ